MAARGIKMNFRTIFLCTLFFCGFAHADNAEDAGNKVHEYFKVFNARDIQKIATEIYSTPVHVGGGAGHRVLATPEAAVENLAQLYVAIDAQGWRESVIDNLKICMASDSLALVDTRYSRIDNNGEPIPPAIRTNLYVLQMIEGAWRIVAFYGHDDDKRPGC
jgi:hypothetical protein